MLRKLLPLLAIGSFVSSWELHAANYADSVVAYSPGTGFATEFGTGIGFTNATAALGEPSRVTPGQFGGPVDPFNPPYLKEQLVSIGAGGSLTVGFSNPIRNDPAHPFGLDFIVFGNAGFVITNGDYSGGGVTDGSLFSANPGKTEVSVSADNVNYYRLDPTRAPVADTLFPMDGSGLFDKPVDPSLTSASFTGLDLAGIRALYQGSGGGTAFDLSWALDGQGQPVSLPEVQFIRIDVLSGVAEVDGIAAVSAVPEPSASVLLGAGLAGLFGVSWFRRHRDPCGRFALFPRRVTGPGLQNGPLGNVVGRGTSRNGDRITPPRA